MTIPLPSLRYTVQSVPANLLQFNNKSSSPPSPPPPSRESTTNSQEPKVNVLWIGCSDSLVSETDVLTNVERSEIFVHRNLGNRVSVGDTSSGSAIEWAVDVLKVQHIIICGHYDCHLLEESESDSNNWYRDIIQLHQQSDALESPAQSPQSRNRHFTELYVLSEVEWLSKQPSVERAMKEWGCQVHAFVFDREQDSCVRLVPESQMK
ncbi:carbonic anhydrase [Sclerotinia borealis F-4128]|uniref:Carbonic anhydrase n=1 Tax=Sclerotinia borealis (strain F-4128) TaxID=1432307 RepID=W9C4V3_SCLBF|nr:carbonic anhydrase [Sclerotinia borealis F-4128]